MKDSRSLSCLLAPFVGSRVDIQLKTNTQITGVLDDCDSNLNLIVGKCLIVRASGTTPETCELLFLNGRQIRYIQFDDVNYEDQLRKSWTYSQRNNKRQEIANRRPADASYAKRDQKQPRGSAEQTLK
jgi:small nuclear ribonucleoprotein (snRNP)-like protein